MKRITFTPQKGQNPNTTVTLPTGEECTFNGGRFETEDPGTAAWLHKLGYNEYKTPGPKKTPAKKRAPRKETKDAPTR